MSSTLTLPKDKVDLDEKGLARWKAEQEQVKRTRSRWIPRANSGNRASWSR